MDIIKWRSSYETGVEEMDMQHKKLIDLINILYRVMRNKESVAVVEGVINEMADYAGVHFRDEEAMLKAIGYPQYDEHISRHRAYRSQMENLMGNYEEDPENTVKEIYAFLRQWWIEHIIEEDKLYGTAIQE